MTSTATIRSALDDLAASLPTRIYAWDITQGIDSTDDHAVWIRAVIDEEDFNRETSLSITDAARDAVRSAAPDLWPYVTIRGLHEDANAP